MKKAEKEKAIGMRQEGASLKNIAKQVGVSKSTVSLWVRGLELTEDARNTIANSYTNGQKAARKTLLARTAGRLLQAKEQAELLIRGVEFSNKDALILCSLLYWCEGAKGPNDNDLTFSNSDPLLVSSYLSLLRRSVHLEETKLRALVHLHEYHDEATQLNFWSEVTNIPLVQFTKTYWKPHTGKRIKPDYPGCIHIGYHDVTVSRQIHATARAFLASENSKQKGL